MRNFLSRLLMASLLPFAGLLHAAQLVSLEDNELGDVTAQALFVSDVVAGIGGSNHTFYRMGMDVNLELNANIDKFALGCGGVNNRLVAAACDIDMDYVRLMGRSGSAPGTAVTSNFRLTRPYIEVAIKNDGNAALREVIGIKIGAQEADGFFGIGRRYANGQVNQEHGGTCGTAPGAAALACHSGLNRVSGNLRVEMSATIPVVANLGILGTYNETGCFGNTATGADTCGVADTYYTNLVGTRMSEATLRDVPIELSGGFLSAIGLDEAFADVRENLRFIHGFALIGTDDFFLSFQREQVRYPNYQKTGYSPTANTGWWMNVPDVKVLNIQGASVTLNGVGAAFDALGEGVNLENIELNQTPPINCYGGSRFC